MKMKMTTEQFLSHLGIELGKEYMCDGRKVYVDKSCLCIWVWIDENRSQTEAFDYLLNKEITPLPKYTLSDDEKAIVRNVSLPNCDKSKTYIKRSVNDEVFMATQYGANVADISSNLFPFIKENEKVLLDELRKCL